MKNKKDVCKYCKKEISFKPGCYRGYCGYNCYVNNQKANKKLDEFIEKRQ